MHTATNTTARVLILHGLDGSPEGHWQPWVAQNLASRGWEVTFPHLPQPSHPNFDYWLGILHLEILRAGPEVTLIAHSLGAYLWLHYASRADAVPVGRVLLVAPPGDIELRSMDRVHALPVGGLDGDAIRRRATQILLVASDDDPYSARGAQAEYAGPLGLPLHRLPDDAGHINIDSGYGPWSLPVEWATHAASQRLAV